MSSANLSLNFKNAWKSPVYRLYSRFMSAMRTLTVFQKRKLSSMLKNAHTSFSRCLSNVNVVSCCKSVLLFQWDRYRWKTFFDKYGPLTKSFNSLWEDLSESTFTHSHTILPHSYYHYFQQKTWSLMATYHSTSVQVTQRIGYLENKIKLSIRTDASYINYSKVAVVMLFLVPTTPW